MGVGVRCRQGTRCRQRQTRTQIWLRGSCIRASKGLLLLLWLLLVPGSLCVCLLAVWQPSIRIVRWLTSIHLLILLRRLRLILLLILLLVLLLLVVLRLLQLVLLPLILLMVLLLLLVGRLMVVGGVLGWRVCSCS